MGAPSPLLRSRTLSDTGAPREGLEEAAARCMHRVPHARTRQAKTGRTPRLRGKSIPIALEKKHKGMGGKFHIQLDILLLEVNLRTSPVQGLLCCALVSPHTWSCRLPTGILGSSVPRSWAGESAPLEGWALLYGWPGSSPCVLSEGFSLPSLLEQRGSSAGFGRDRI